MPQLKASVRFDSSFAAFERKLQSAPPELKETLRRSAPQIAKPMAEAVKKAQSSSPERQVSSRMAPTTRATSENGLPAVVTGGPPFTMGAEYGGQRRIALTGQPVYGRMPRRQYRKRLTMQFRPHRGRTGYEVWPTIRREGAKVIEGYSKALDRAMKRVGLA